MLRHVDDDKDPEKEEELKSTEYYNNLSKSVPWYHRLLLNRKLKLAIVFVFVAIIAPVLIYQFCYIEFYKKQTVTDGLSIGSCSHLDIHRMRCGLSNITMAECRKQCCWNDEKESCYHRMPSRYSYKRPISRWHADIQGRMLKNISKVVMTPRQEYTPYGNAKNLPRLKLHVNDLSQTHVKFVLYDSSVLTYPAEDITIPDKKFDYIVYDLEFQLEMISLNENITAPLFSTTRGPLVASKDIWEWSFYMGDENVYGMGDIVLDSKEPELFYNIDQSSSFVPFFMSQRNGSYHGIYLEHRGPMEFSMLENKVINVKSFAGQSLILHFFYGENPAEILKEFYRYIDVGEIPAPWTLGAHFCRSNTTHWYITEGIKNATAFITESKKFEMPYDSDCIISEMFQFINSNISSSENEEILAAIKTLSDAGKKFFPSIRPHVRVDNTSGPYETARDNRLLILDPADYVEYEGGLFNDSAVYPDYGLEETKTWLEENWPFEPFANSFMIKDNWPKNLFRSVDCSVVLPYVTQNMNETFCQSIPWNAKYPKTNVSYHRDHNSYGSNFASVVKEITTKLSATEKPFIVSSSNNLESLTAFNLQGVETSWVSLRNNFRRAVATSMFGARFLSLPVCGDSTTFSAPNLEDLCMKWYQASAFLPMFYVESNVVPRHPFAFSGFARDVMINAVKTRYKLIPYFNTVLNKGEPLIRAMFYDFYKDEETLDLDQQFMVGEAIMIAPDFNPALTTINMYFPPTEKWFDFLGGKEITPGENGWIEIPTIATQIPIYTRSGFVIPMQETIYPTAVEMRKESPYTIKIGLDCPEGDTGCSAKGMLFVGEGTFIEFYATNEMLEVRTNIVKTSAYLCEPTTKTSASVIDKIIVSGLTDLYIKDNLKIDFCDEHGRDGVLQIKYY